ncbi:hypothetical protein ANN_26965 [Periplaneta americana]|uniref:Uncharacterized protein n=1 Tax=Periplaneta americana TaxID=6978 RepID=A0ABQ8RWT1_PERAM|nr:hypothetical protein ANN_26965 [Periplaneta americana]
MQNHYLRLMSGAPWYIRNKKLHNDLCIPEVIEFLRQSYIRLYHSFLNHMNPLLRAITTNPLQDPSP